jgi:superfamily II DNA or RNA helicase
VRTQADDRKALQNVNGRERDLALVSLLDPAKPLYLLPRDDLSGEVLIPGFSVASQARCMVGFFSSAVLADLAPGLATYIGRESESLRLIISPFLSATDQEALEAGTRDPVEVATEFFGTNLIGVDALQQHTLKCLSYLLAVGRIEIRIALMKDGLFHPKVWLFDTTSERVAAHGSSNMTRSGIKKNKEQVTVSKSWADPTQHYIADKLSDEFERLWLDRDEDCLVIDMPRAVAEGILRAYPTSDPPTEKDFQALFERVRAGPNPTTPLAEGPAKPVAGFAIPGFLKWNEGPFAHQGEAVRAWIANGFRGTLEMATGSGKTITAMIGAYELHEQQGSLCVVIAAPYIPLIDQWYDEVAQFGVTPWNLSSLGGAQERNRVMQQIQRRLRLGLSSIEVMVVSHDTLCTTEFIIGLKKFECPLLLVADEAHNLGRSAFITSPPEFIQYRLALSATPVRQYDQEGSDALFAYFGDVVFQFTLADAIGVCLVEYDYFVHPVHLNATEMDEWRELTGKIRQSAWRTSNGKPDDYLSKLLRDRRVLLETAEGKIHELSKLLDKLDLRALRYTLIYTTDKRPQQLDAVNELLNAKGVLFHQLTSEETADRRLTKAILGAFKRGEIQVLTAKRVLDEGVNIPEIETAFILASTTVERQWIQRRGRLLRMCSEIGKTHSEIHDFIALPAVSLGEVDDDSRTMLKSELRRMQEFARLARNAGSAGGPLSLIHQMVTATLM